MKSLVVFGAQGADASDSAAMVSETVIGGHAVRSAFIEAPDPDFDPSHPDNHERVLVRNKAFSCNYRDKHFIHLIQQFPAHRYGPFGSEFVGEVVDVGEKVDAFEVGDRVVTNHHYTGAWSPEDTYREGVSTNRASQGWHVIHQNKVVPVPNEMSDATAAAFSLNAQTAYSMVRRLEVKDGQKVLVTSATSNVSLFSIPLLLSRGAEVFAATTSPDSRSTLLEMGVSKVIPVDREEGFHDSEIVLETARDELLFDRVLDPFFDLHIARAVDLLRPFGKYCTCGLLDQVPTDANGSGAQTQFGVDLFAKTMMKNLSLIGNCIGLREDLENALADYSRGAYDVPVDSVFTNYDSGAFLDRTFNTTDRLGKVVYQFAS
jgi:NADPH:quinone reductase-like Zn-dependent oxidoreductase